MTVMVIMTFVFASCLDSLKSMVHSKFQILSLHTSRKRCSITFDYTSVLLIHCLREFDSHFLLNDVKMFYKTGVPPLQVPTSFWVEVMVMIMNIEGMQEKFEIKLPVRCDQKVLRSLPEILKSKKAMLRFSNLSDTCCPALASVLGVRESHLRELDLGFNSITDRGVESLVQGLSDQDCRLKSLRLQGCELTSSACEHLATVLKQRPNLKELDLSCNSIGDVGLKHLANGLESPMCQLETLRISQCNIKREGGFHLASALEKNPSYLKWLDLSINRIGNKAANELFTKFDISRLRKLEMCFCGLTERCCATISDALKLEKSCLVELNLSSNNLKDAGAHLISAGLFAWSRLEKLNISRCGISKLGCFYLSKVLSCISALYSENMHMEIGWQATELREMDLSRNKLTDEGAVYISTGLCNPYSHLRRLNWAITASSMPASLSSLSKSVSLLLPGSSVKARTTVDADP
ncbi:ribonuclease inhibitor-like isoform X3 [Boleophthalmus pectinirostris]|uniref:ribonuclease inhibitor-like isoform X3 n=1 Tax=Boleophthalmus pectinirostris TaxID=150288 RepID=UPI0024328AC0|nr:ribonuclease inhibitor-like isoform X3 [Boleophthalmus pectinirostris]